MPGYVIADMTVTDPETYAGYRALTPGTIAAFGGRFLVRGGDHEVIGGTWTPGRLVLLEFESPARAAAWYDSPAYVEARAIRQSASTGNVILLKGSGRAEIAGGIYLIVRHADDGSGPALAGAVADGGRALSVRQAPEVKEGTWSGERLTVIEFDDRAAAVRWYVSKGDWQVPFDAVLVEGA